MSKTAFITGATSGFGLAAARRFVAAGWKVVATGRRSERLQALVAELGADRVHPACFDVRDVAAGVQDGLWQITARWRFQHPQDVIGPAGFYTD